MTEDLKVGDKVLFSIGMNDEEGTITEFFTNDKGEVMANIGFTKKDGTHKEMHRKVSLLTRAS